MKNIITIALLLVASIGFSQDFSFSKIFYQEQTLQLEGTIKVTDTIIYMIINGEADTLQVRNIFEINDVKQFKSNGKGEDTLIRITLKNPENPSKQFPITLTYELKDTFANTYSKIIYFLKEDE